MSATFPQLATAWYDESLARRHIRDAAHARRVAPDALLGAVLARTAASIPPNVMLDLPLRSGLNFFTALIGESGDGKSKANRVACELLPDVCENDELPIGSGEGLIDVYMELVDEITDGSSKPRRVKRQRHDRAYFYFDEGEILLRHKKRQDTTIEQNLRTAWVGGPIGTTNADSEKRRRLEANSYRLALTMGLQPMYAGQLLVDHEGGTPQRFLYVSAVDAYMPETRLTWRGTLDLPTGYPLLISVDPQIIRLIDENTVRHNRGTKRRDQLDTHADLMTVKMAALIAHLDGVHHVSLDYWNSANLVYDNSRQLRQTLQQRAKIEKRAHLDERLTDKTYADEVTEAARQKRDLHRIIAVMGRAVIKRGPLPEPMLLSALGRDRHKIPDDELIEAAVREGLIVKVNDKPIEYGPPRAYDK